MEICRRTSHASRRSGRDDGFHRPVPAPVRYFRTAKGVATTGHAVAQARGRRVRPPPRPLPPDLRRSSHACCVTSSPSISRTTNTLRGGFLIQRRLAALLVDDPHLNNATSACSCPICADRPAAAVAPLQAYLDAQPPPHRHAEHVLSPAPRSPSRRRPPGLQPAVSPNEANLGISIPRTKPISECRVSPNEANLGLPHFPERSQFGVLTRDHRIVSFKAKLPKTNLT